MVFYSRPVNGYARRVRGVVTNTSDARFDQQRLLSPSCHSVFPKHVRGCAYPANIYPPSLLPKWRIRSTVLLCSADCGLRSAVMEIG